MKIKRSEKITTFQHKDFMRRDFLVLDYPLFPVQGCPYNMDLNADLTHNDKWLFNNVVKTMWCVTPIQLAYYIF